MIKRVQSVGVNKCNPSFGTIKAMPNNAIEVIESAIILLRKPNINSVLEKERELATSTHFLADMADEALESAREMGSECLLKGKTEGNGARFSLEITGIDGKISETILNDLPTQRSLTTMHDIIYASAKLLRNFAKAVKIAYTEEESVIKTMIQKTNGRIS